MKIAKENPEVLNHMIKSEDVLTRVIAKRILIAGGDQNA
jgi:hypothetical protein